MFVTFKRKIPVLALGHETGCPVLGILIFSPGALGRCQGIAVTLQSKSPPAH